jgi:hypothetical protein
MTLGRIARVVGIGCLVGVGVLVSPGKGNADPLGIYSFCCHEVCPPCYCHCAEYPPKIKFCWGCPKRVCPPCTLEHFGYYQTCWQPWPFPPDWSHCPVPPCGALVAGGPPGPVMPDTAAPLPPPRKADGTPGARRTLYYEERE